MVLCEQISVLKLFMNFRIIHNLVLKTRPASSNTDNNFCIRSSLSKKAVVDILGIWSPYEINVKASSCVQEIFLGDKWGVVQKYA